MANSWRPVKNRLYSIKKNLFLELENYSFFHSPSEPEALDERFTGREKQIRKLKSILEKGNSHSGVYLITGFRGMGKSSLINKVLSDYAWKPVQATFLVRIFRILLFLLVASVFFGVLHDKQLFKWGLGLSMAFLTLYLIISDNRTDLVRAGFRKNGRLRRHFGWHYPLQIGKAFVRIFYLYYEERFPNRFRLLAKDLLFTGIIMLTFLFIGEYCWEQKGKYQYLYPTMDRLAILFIVLLLGIMLIGYLSKAISQEKARWGKRNPGRNLKFRLLYNWKFRDAWRNFTVWISRQAHYFRIWLRKVIEQPFNRSRLIQVKINLGHDKLEEIDILRMVAKQITASFREYRRKALLRSWDVILKKIIWLMILYVVIWGIYYSHGVSKLREQLFANTGLYEYFPSQALWRIPVETTDATQFYLPDGIPLDTLNKYRSEGQPNYQPNRLLPIPGWDLDAKILDTLAHINEPDIYDDFRAAILAIRPKTDTNLLPLKSEKTFFRTFFNSVDQLLFRAWHKLIDVTGLGKHALSNPGLNSSTALIKSGATFLAARPDYLFWLYYLLFYFLFRWLGTRRIFFYTPGAYISRRLKNLEMRIDASLALETNANTKIAPLPFLPLFGGAGFGRKRRRQYSKMSEREIELELIDIFKEINSSSRIISRPEFVVVFDELDKIQPRSELTDDGEQYGEDSPGFSTYGNRERKERIGKILSNLKFFFNTARAKFFFITGREMYDLSLADITDRDSFFGSVFHDVIYVNSFLTDDSDGKLIDLRIITEQYLIKCLLPPDSGLDYNLSDYRWYLEKHYLPGPEHWETRAYIISLLQQFITYLTFRSNGAPKKLVRNMEDFVGTYDMVDKHKSINNVCIGKNKDGLYLHFDFYAQHRIGMLNYLTFPFFILMNHYVEGYSDKMVVSASFISDHLYKFHKGGFSLRNLELTPEIIDINKSPELRSLVEELIRMLKEIHLEDILGGLFDLKFNRRIAEEIAYLSKVSEEESAALNFTLDESLDVRRFFSKKLRQLKKGKAGSEDFVYSLYYLHNILADLNYFDEKYDDAIEHYLESMQGLMSASSDQLKLTELLLLVRSRLKVGLILEKKGIFDSALMNYETIISLVSQHMQMGFIKEYKLKAVKVYLEPIALDETTANSLFQESEPDYKSMLRLEDQYKDALSQEVAAELYQLLESTHRECLHLYFRLEKKKVDGQDTKTYEFKGHEQNLPLTGILHSKFYESYLDKQLGQKISIAENARLIYQPILARLQIMEKVQAAGITYSDLHRAENEFYFIYNLSHRNEKALLEAEFLIRVGDILYYKNGLIRVFDQQHRPIPKKVDQVKPYCHRANAICGKNINYPLNAKIEAGNKEGSPPNTVQAEQEGLSPNYNAPCSACEYYMRSLKVHSNNILRTNEWKNSRRDAKIQEYQTACPTVFKEYKIIFELIEFLGKVGQFEADKQKNVLLYQSLATALSSAGNTFWSCASKKDKVRIDFLKILVDKQFITTISDTKKESKGPGNVVPGTDSGKVNPDQENRATQTGPGSQQGHQEEMAQNLIKSLADFLKADKPDGRLSKMEEALLYLMLSAEFYLRVGMFKHYALQYTKIIEFMKILGVSMPKNNEKISETQPDDAMIRRLEARFVYQAIRSIYRAYGYAHVPELERFNRISHPTKPFLHIPLQHLERQPYQAIRYTSTYPDVRNIILSYARLELYWQKSPLDFFRYKFSNLVLPYANVSMFHIRQAELFLKSNINHERFVNLFLRSLNPRREPDRDKRKSFSRRLLKKALLNLLREERKSPWDPGKDFDNMDALFHQLRHQFEEVSSSEKTSQRTEESGPDGNGEDESLQKMATVAEIVDTNKVGNPPEEVETPKSDSGSESPPSSREAGHTFSFSFSENYKYLMNHVLIPDHRNPDQEFFICEVEDIGKDVQGYQHLGQLKPDQAKTQNSGEHRYDQLIKKLEIALAKQGWSEEEIKKVEWEKVEFFESFFELAFEDNINKSPKKAHKNWKYIPPERLQAANLLSYFIADSVANYLLIISVFRIFGLSYVANHSLLAVAHDRLSFWLVMNDWFMEIYLPRLFSSSGRFTLPLYEKQKNMFLKRHHEVISELSGAHFTSEMLNFHYHEGLARIHYHKSIYTHNGGTAYREFIGKMFYLDDHFTDHELHFEAAKERYLINTGYVDQRIKDLRDRMEDDQVREDYRAYL